MDFINRILHDWLVLFSMVNAVGNLPLFADLTSAMDARQRSQAFRTAIMTAASIVLTFAFFGSWMLNVAFEVDTNAFKVAGGILVFVVAARGRSSPGQMLSHGKRTFPAGMTADL